MSKWGNWHLARPNESSYIRTGIYTKINSYISIYLIDMHLYIFSPVDTRFWTNRYAYIYLFMHDRRGNKYLIKTNVIARIFIDLNEYCRRFLKGYRTTDKKGDEEEIMARGKNEKGFMPTADMKGFLMSKRMKWWISWQNQLSYPYKRNCGIIELTSHYNKFSF